MLIVGCQTCGEAKVLAGTPDKDGVARVKWTCRRCGTGQVLQLDVTEDARAGDLRSILGGLALHRKDDGQCMAPDDLDDLEGPDESFGAWESLPR